MATRNEHDHENVGVMETRNEQDQEIWGYSIIPVVSGSCQHCLLMQVEKHHKYMTNTLYIALILCYYPFYHSINKLENGKGHNDPHSVQQMKK
jgi:hypothetical protein